jgi:Heavy metal associated domain 2
MSMHLHHVRGRLRIRVPAVKGCIAQARALEASLTTIQGITHVECRTVTGSVIVHYDPSTVDAVALLRSLGHEDVSPELSKVSPASAPGITSVAQRRPNRLAAKTVQAILWFALENAAERALPLLLAAVL